MLFAILVLFNYQKGWAQSSKNDIQWKNLDTAFARVLRDWHAAGFSVAVVVKDKVVYSRGFGYKDYENKFRQHLQPSMPSDPVQKHLPLH